MSSRIISFELVVIFMEIVPQPVEKGRTSTPQQVKVGRTSTPQQVKVGRTSAPQKVKERAYFYTSGKLERYTPLLIFLGSFFVFRL